MNEVIEKENVDIRNMIYEFRGVEVMLDSDLAKLYECKNGTKEINQAVKNNKNKFPNNFCFRITEQDYVSLKSKKLTSKGGSRKGHTVFTEEGVAMLATIIHSKIAAEISIRIMEAFVSMRHYLIDNKNIYKSLNHINNKILEHDEKFDELFSKFDKKERLLLTGEKCNAYSSTIDILNSAKNEIIIIDPYADIILLSLLEEIKCNIVIITNNSDRLNNELIEKYNNKYHNLKVIRDNTFHDRFIIIDKKYYYHFGTSINSLGEKISMIIKLEDSDVKELLLNNIKRVIGGIND